MDENILYIICIVIGIAATLCYNRWQTGHWSISNEEVKNVHKLVEEIFAFFTKSEPITKTSLATIEQIPKASYTLSDEYKRLIYSTCRDYDELHEVKDDIDTAELYSSDPTEYTIETTGKYGGVFRVDVGRPVLITPYAKTYNYFNQSKLAELVSLNTPDTFNILTTIIEHERNLDKVYTFTTGDYEVTVNNGEYVVKQIASETTA